jgi:hypothetical protein
VADHHPRVAVDTVIGEDGNLSLEMRPVLEGFEDRGHVRYAHPLPPRWEQRIAEEARR